MYTPVANLVRALQVLLTPVLLSYSRCVDAEPRFVAYCRLGADTVGPISEIINIGILIYTIYINDTQYAGRRGLQMQGFI